MLARYKMYFYNRPADDPLPEGIRKDSRKHTKHCLRPTEKMVQALLADSKNNWKQFKQEYVALLSERFKKNRVPFDELNALATDHDVYIGCSCPTAKNPDVRHCHTVLALQFMKRKYPHLDVRFPY